MRHALNKHLITGFHKTQLVSNHMLLLGTRAENTQVPHSSLTLGTGLHLERGSIQNPTAALQLPQIVISEAKELSHQAV